MNGDLVEWTRKRSDEETVGRGAGGEGGPGRECAGREKTMQGANASSELQHHMDSTGQLSQSPARLRARLLPSAAVSTVSEFGEEMRQQGTEKQRRVSRWYACLTARRVAAWPPGRQSEKLRWQTRDAASTRSIYTRRAA